MRPLNEVRSGVHGDRAREMMSVALDLFAERNFASVTIKDIARMMGVNTALIYYYFDSKEDLFRAVIEDAVEQAFANFHELEKMSDDPVELIDEWLNNHVSLYDRIHKLVKISLDYKGLPNPNPKIDRSIQHFYEEERRVLSKCIGTGIRRGIFRPVHRERIAQYISTYLDGVMVRAVILPDFDREEAINDLRQTIWELLDYKARRKRARKPSMVR